MLTTCFVKKAGRLLVLLGCLSMLSACDQVRTRLGELISPEPPAQALQAVDRLIDEGKFQEAKDKAASRTQKADAPLRGQFAMSAARASAFKGDTEDALRYLALAFDSMPLNTDEVMSEPAFRSLQTNIRFLQLITQASAPAQSPAAPQAAKAPAAQATAPAPSPVLEVGAGSAQIRQDSKGTEVRAGDVVVRLPN